MENFETYKLDQTGQQTQAILDQVATNTADIAQLRALYEALTQSEPIIIKPDDTWPVADPQENVIYRVIDRVNTPPQSYSDYMWNGTAMVLMATYNNSIDNEPTPGSNNLVKSGGVAASIIFDISAYHATGSTLATYSNLAAALGTDGANVPASVRKGGMSVKFVQSADNKYVQSRCMAQDFTTDVTQWQGIDDEPTAESENLVKSGGVAFEIGKLESLLGTENETLSPTPAARNPTGYVINFVTGSYVSQSNCSLTNPVTINKGEGVVAVLKQYSTVCAMYKTTRPSDNYGTITPLVEGFDNTTELKLYIYAAEQDNEYIGFGYLTDGGLSVYKVSSDVLKNIYNLIDEKQREINEINADINTISAEQDYITKTVQTQAGTDAAIDIPISIPKGEICLVKADWGDNISRTDSAITFNEESSVAAYSIKGQWTLIKPTVNVIKVHTECYRTQVVGTGDFSLTIKKLQAITKDGKLPLYDGGLSANGTIWANANRKNTRVIFNDGPLFITLNSPYELHYYYGNDPENLSEGGYITDLKHDGKYVLDIDFKYVGFTIVKPSDETFDNLQFFVSNNNSPASSLRRIVDANMQIVDNNSLMGSAFPFVSGTIDESDGHIIANSKRLSSQVVYFNGTLVVENDLSKFNELLPFYRAKGTSTFVSQGWQSNRLQYEITGEGEFYVVLSSTSNVTPDDAANIGLFVRNTAKEISKLPVYNFSVIGNGNLYYDEPNIVLRKGCRYKAEFESGIFNTNATGSSEILNIGAYNVDNPEQAVNLAYRTAASVTIPSTLVFIMPYDGFIRQYSRLTKDSYLNVKITQLSEGFKTALSEVTPNKDKFANYVNNQKTRQFFDGDLLTRVQDILAFGGGFDISSEMIEQNIDNIIKVIVRVGDFYAGLLWAENAAGEYQQPHYNVGLIIGNILDVAGTKERKVVANYGDAILDGYGYDAITGEAIAKRISDNEIAVFVGGYYINGVPTAATRIYNLATETWGDFQKCYLNVDDNGTERRFQIRSNEADMRQIHSITGMHNWDNIDAITGKDLTATPPKYGDFGYYASNNPIKIGEWFWLFMDIGAYAPSLVKTQDFIDFYYVCELPFGAYKEIDNEQVFVWNPTEEVAIEYFNNRIYAVCRGNKGRFPDLTEGVDYYGYNQIMSANYDDILAGTPDWQIVNLEPYWAEKPTIVAFNGLLYCYNGVRGNWSYKGVEGKNLNRFKHMFYIFDRDLNILKQELLNSDDGYLHPTFMKYGNAVYSLNCTDWRNLTYFDTGDNRSELRLKRLDMQILGM